jgi:hypothetical protein
MSSPHSNFGGAVGERGWVMLAGVVEHTKERLKKKKKKDTRHGPCCLSQADTEKPVKSTMCSKDSPDYDRIKREREEKEEGRKRHGLYDQAPKQTSA